MDEVRLIDANALKEKAIRVSTVKEHTYLKAVGTHEIDKAPTVDAVHVVRCKDCKSYRLFKNRFGVEISRCMLIGADVGSDDYCSYGERKDGDNHG